MWRALQTREEAPCLSGSGRTAPGLAPKTNAAEQGLADRGLLPVSPRSQACLALIYTASVAASVLQWQS